MRRGVGPTHRLGELLRWTANWGRANTLLSAAIVGGIVARIVFWALTDRRFEDALITIKHAANAADGNGLVHHLGEGHVHGFTSAVSVLIPLPAELIVDGGGFLAIRLASLAAFAVAAVYASRLAKKLDLGTWPTALVLAYLAFDQLQIFYGMSGMETQVAVAILLASIFYVWEDDYPKAGISLGLATLARPDMLLWVGPALVFMFVRRRRNAIRTAAVWVATIAPWLVFTTLYYGSPIPQTIHAKSQALPPYRPDTLDPGAWIDYAVDQISFNQNTWQLLAPFLERSSTVATPVASDLLKVVAIVVATLAVVGAVASWRYRPWRAVIAYVALFLVYKFLFLPNAYYEWYYPPTLILIIFLAAAGLRRLAASLPRMTAVAAGVLALLFAVHMPFSFPLEARVQHDIEDRVRDPLGRYLAETVRPGETITSESSGYVGYFTNAELNDSPGLTSTTSYEALRAHPEDLSVCGVLHLLRSDWAVLRPFEREACQARYPETVDAYREVRRFSVPQSESSLNRWGLEFFNIDREFVVLQRFPQHP